MICKHCGTEINTKIREADGSVVCPGCGTVYRPKSAPKPEQRPAVAPATEPRPARTDNTPRNSSQPRRTAKRSGAGLKAAIAIFAAVLVIGGVIAAILFLNKTSIEAFSSEKTYRVGDTFTLGAYEQDNNTSNGKEPIEWIVLDKEDDQIFVISKYALDSRAFDTEYSDSVWATCSLRSWLNEDFYSTSFNTEERSLISTAPNSSYDSGLRSLIHDRVSILTVSEAEKYFQTNSDRRCKPTAYAKAQGCNVTKGYCWWWLCSEDGDIAGVESDGTAFTYDDYRHTIIITGNDGVRPVLWIKSGEAKTMDSSLSFQDSPSNYFYGGLVARGDDGYTYFAQYDTSDYEHQTINICRFSDNSMQAEVFWSQQATSVDIRSDSFSGHFYSVYDLTTYKDKLFFLCGNPDLDYLTIYRINTLSGEIAEINTSGPPINAAWARARHDGRYLFFGGGYKLDMEEEALSLIFDPQAITIDESLGIGDDFYPQLLGVENGIMYFVFSHIDDNYPVFEGPLYCVPVSGGAVEEMKSIRFQQTNLNLITGSFVGDSTLWIRYEDDEGNITLSSFNLLTGEQHNSFPNEVGEFGFAITGEGIYYFDEAGCLWVCDLNGSTRNLLIDNSAAKAYQKTAPMVCGDRIFFANAEDDYGLICVNKNDTSFPSYNVMGESIESGGSYWGNGPVW